MKTILIFAFLFSTSFLYANDPEQTKKDLEKIEKYLLVNPGDSDLIQLRDNYKDRLAKIKKKSPKKVKKKNQYVAQKMKAIAASETRKIERKWEKIKEEAEPKQRAPANKTAPEIREKSNLKVGAMLDFYYLYNFNDPVGGSSIPSRNYDTLHNDFTMNLLELNFQGTYGEVGYYADLDFGNFAEQNSGHTGDGVGHNVGQAYLTYDINGYLISAGKMYTNVGYEVAKAQDNWNYSRAFTFTLGGPFWHEGVSLVKTYDSGIGWGLFIYDDWDSRNETNNEKTYSLQLKHSKGDLNFVYNYITGRQNAPGTQDADGNGIETEQKSLHEFNGQWDFSSNWSVAINALSGVDSKASGVAGNVKDYTWQSYVLYLHWHNTDWGVTGRLEKYTANNNLPSAQDNSTLSATQLDLSSYTLTGSYKIDENSEFRLEARSDVASEKFYLKDGRLDNGQSTLSLSWLFKM